MNRLSTYLLLTFLSVISITCKYTELKETVNSGQAVVKQNTTEPKIKFLTETYLGNSQRNYYGIHPPEKLNLKWRTYLGYGYSSAYRAGGSSTWTGSGWTGLQNRI